MASVGELIEVIQNGIEYLREGADHALGAQGGVAVTTSILVTKGEAVMAANATVLAAVDALEKVASELGALIDDSGHLGGAEQLTASASGWLLDGFNQFAYAAGGGSERIVSATLAANRARSAVDKAASGIVSMTAEIKEVCAVLSAAAELLRASTATIEHLETAQAIAGRVQESLDEANSASLHAREDAESYVAHL
jgi:hypothetical protein